MRHLVVCLRQQAFLFVNGSASGFQYSTDDLLIAVITSEPNVAESSQTVNGSTVKDTFVSTVCVVCQSVRPMCIREMDFTIIYSFRLFSFSFSASIFSFVIKGF